MQLTHAALPHMIAQAWGRIINVASVAGFSPGVAGHTLYPAAKSFVVKFSQSLDCEVRTKGIHVTAVAIRSRSFMRRVEWRTL